MQLGNEQVKQHIYEVHQQHIYSGSYADHLLQYIYCSFSKLNPPTNLTISYRLGDVWFD